MKYCILILNCFIFCFSIAYYSCKPDNTQNIDTDMVKTVSTRKIKLKLFDTISFSKEGIGRARARTLEVRDYNNSPCLWIHDEFHSKIFILDVANGNKVDSFIIHRNGPFQIIDPLGFTILNDSLVIVGGGGNIPAIFYKINKNGEILEKIKLDEELIPFYSHTMFGLTHQYDKNRKMIYMGNMFLGSGNFNKEKVYPALFYNLESGISGKFEYRISKSHWKNGLYDENPLLLLVDELDKLIVSHIYEDIFGIVDLTTKNWVNLTPTQSLKITHKSEKGITDSPEKYFDYQCKNAKYISLLYDRKNKYYIRIVYPGDEKLSIEQSETIYNNFHKIKIITLDSTFTQIGLDDLPSYTYDIHCYFQYKERIYFMANYPGIGPMDKEKEENKIIFHGYTFEELKIN